MLIFLYGPDSYRRQQKLNSIITEHQKDHPGVALDRFYLDQKGEVERLKEFTIAQSLFSGTEKIGVIYELTETEFEKDLVLILKSVTETKDIVLVVVAEKKLTKAFDFLLKKPVVSQLFESLPASELLLFINGEARRKGMTASPLTIQQLIASFSGDTWAIMTELEKMDLGATHEPRLAIPEFFPLVQTLKSQRSLADRLYALAVLLEHEYPAAAFNVTASLVDSAAKQKMADYDVAIKSGKLEYEEALLDLVIG